MFRSMDVLSFFYIWVIICNLVAFPILAAPKNKLSIVFKLSQEIKDNEATLAPAAIIAKLMAIKSARTQVGNVLALFIDHRHEIMIGLSLYRLVMTLNVDRCLQPKTYSHSPNYYADNIHANNYIELNRIVKEYYETENMHRFIDSYYNIQYEICAHNIYTNFASKYESMQQDYDPEKIDDFVTKLNDNFPSETSIDELDLESKMDGFKRFILSFYDREFLSFTNRTRASGIRGLLKAILNSECNNYLLSPLNTLMMTYDLMNRNVASVNENYSHLMRAYDLCAALKDHLGSDDLDEIEERILKHIGSNRPITRQKIQVQKADRAKQSADQSSSQALGKRKQNLDTNLITQEAISFNDDQDGTGQKTPSKYPSNQIRSLRSLNPIEKHLLSAQNRIRMVSPKESSANQHVTQNLFRLSDGLATRDQNQSVEMQPSSKPQLDLQLNLGQGSRSRHDSNLPSLQTMPLDLQLHLGRHQEPQLQLGLYQFGQSQEQQQQQQINQIPQKGLSFDVSDSDSGHDGAN